MAPKGLQGVDRATGVKAAARRKQRTDQCPIEQYQTDAEPGWKPGQPPQSLDQRRTWRLLISSHNRCSSARSAGAASSLASRRAAMTTSTAGRSALICRKASRHARLKALRCTAVGKAFLGTVNPSRGCAVADGSSVTTNPLKPWSRLPFCSTRSKSARVRMRLLRANLCGALFSRTMIRESGACGPWPGAGRGLCDRQRSPCERESRACACDADSTVEMCVSLAGHPTQKRAQILTALLVSLKWRFTWT